MTKNTLLALFCALTLGACTSVRVHGFITDERTGDLIPTAGVTIGQRYVHVDTAGHYLMNARKSWKNMQVVAPGYETKTMTVDLRKARAPQVDVQLTPKKTAKGHAVGEASKADVPKVAPKEADSKAAPKATAPNAAPPADAPATGRKTADAYE